MVAILTRAEDAAIAEIEALYAKLGVEAKGEFHKAIGVFSAHPLAMFGSGIAFGILLMWAL